MLFIISEIFYSNDEKRECLYCTEAPDYLDAVKKWRKKYKYSTPVGDNTFETPSGNIVELDAVAMLPENCKSVAQYVTKI